MDKLIERIEVGSNPIDDKLVAALDDVQRALATKGIWGRHFALDALREHFAGALMVYALSGETSSADD